MMSDAWVNKRQAEIYKENRRLQDQINRCIDVVEHAKIVRKELKVRFPHLKFMVRTSRYAGGNSVTVYHKDVDLTKEQEKEIKDFVKQFDGYRGDLCDGRYNVGFEYKGERLQGASFCMYNHKWYRG